MKKINIFAVTMAAAISLALLGGCGESGSGGSLTTPPTTDPTTWNTLEREELVEITLAGRDVDTEKANYQAFVNDFNETHDNIIVNLQWWADTSAYNIALDAMGADLPDVFMLSNGKFLSYAASGKLANIREYVDESLLDDMYPDGYEVYYFDHATKTIGKTDDAALYGLPKDEGPYALAINEDLLKQRVSEYNATASEADKINIDRIMDTTDPMTYSYFLEIGEKLNTVLGSGEFVISGYNQQSAVFSNNATYFTNDGAWEAAIDSDNFVDAITFIQDMYKKSILPAAGTNTNAETVFTSGKSLFYYVGPWQTKDWWKTCDFTWNILPVIRGEAEGAVSSAYVGGMCYAISNNCKYKDAALELVEYLSADPTSQRTQYKRGQCIPNLVSLATEYATDSLGLIAKQTATENPCPANRSVWIDVVDGVGTTKTKADGTTYTDVVTGRYRAESYSIDELWFTNFNNYIGGSTNSSVNLWKQVNGQWLDVRTVLTQYKETMQADLDVGYKYLMRM